MMGFWLAIASAVLVWVAYVARAWRSWGPRKPALHVLSLRAERDAGLVFYGAGLLPGRFSYERWSGDTAVLGEDPGWLCRGPDGKGWWVSAENEAPAVMAAHYTGDPGAVRAAAERQRECDEGLRWAGYVRAVCGHPVFFSAP